MRTFYDYLFSASSAAAALGGAARRALRRRQGMTQKPKLPNDNNSDKGILCGELKYYGFPSPSHKCPCRRRAESRPTGYQIENWTKRAPKLPLTAKGFLIWISSTNRLSNGRGNLVWMWNHNSLGDLFPTAICTSEKYALLIQFLRKIH